ncbi:MAG: hypothetical protein M3O15_06140, partial [Acidobacteriota bacterium]|nr:hypothetical protein [Acidobacteriota bacterium]
MLVESQHLSELAEDGGGGTPDLSQRIAQLAQEHQTDAAIGPRDERGSHAWDEHTSGDDVVQRRDEHAQ